MEDESTGNPVDDVLRQALSDAVSLDDLPQEMNTASSPRQVDREILPDKAEPIQKPTRPMQASKVVPILPRVTVKFAGKRPREEEEEKVVEPPAKRPRTKKQVEEDELDAGNDSEATQGSDASDSDEGNETQAEIFEKQMVIAKNARKHLQMNNLIQWCVPNKVKVEMKPFGRMDCKIISQCTF